MVTSRRYSSLTFSLTLCSLTIKGNADDDAVLCTADKTYSMRSVVLSNSILVVTVPPTTENGDISESGSRGVVIRDQLQEIIELVPSVPKLHRLNELLKGREYDEDQERFEGGFEDDGHDERPVSAFECSYKWLLLE
jgi:sister chromatid cohesion protein DCC1